MTKAKNPTKKENMNALFASMTQRCRNGKKKRKLMMTQEEFFALLSKSSEYNKVYGEWKKSGFQARLAPSIDRIDNEKNYSADNIQVLTRYENLLKGDGDHIPNRTHLQEIRNELVWILSEQGYNGADIGQVFNINRSTVSDALKLRPAKWIPKWVKAQ